MKISERALNFAINAYKKENNNKFVLRPMVVGEILKYYGFDDKVVAAGYLHNIIKESNYTIDDISILFGGDVSSLIMTVTSPEIFEDLNQKLKTIIKNYQNLPLRNKLIILANLIAEIEEIRINNDNQKIDDKKMNFIEHKKYYQKLSENLRMISEDIRLNPLLDRLYSNIDELFYNQKVHNFNTNKIIFNQTGELENLKYLLKSPKPFIIKFSKNKYVTENFMHLCLNFLNKDAYHIKVFNDELCISKYESEYINDQKGLNLEERNLLITSEISTNVLSELSDGQSIVILEETLFNRLILIRRLLDHKELTEEELESYIKFYLPKINNLINYQNLTYSDINNTYNNNLEFYQQMLNGHNLFIDSNKSSSNYRVLENLIPIMKSDYIIKLKLMLEKKNKNN